MAPVTRVILQARTNSSRLPAKALLPVGGLPLVVLAARRAMRLGADLCVATSIDASDDTLAHTLESHGIRIFRGSLEDVLDRFAKAAADLPDDVIVVRLTGDNVFPDADFVNELVAAFQERGSEYLACGGSDSGIAYGMSGEAFSVSVLREAAAVADSLFDREHVTPWIKRKYQVPQASCSPDNKAESGHLRCTVDTLDDYLRVVGVFEQVADPVAEPWRKLVARLQELPGAARFSINGAPDGGASMVLGTAQLGLHYGRENTTGMPGNVEANAILGCAIDHGIVEFDTARAYGLSERRIGSFLSRYPTAQATVLTKLDPLRDLSEAWPNTAIFASVDASVLASCHALRLDRLPVLMVHRAEHLEVARGQVWARLLQLQSEGFIERIGASVQSPAELQLVLAVPEIKHVQLPYNILDWRWRDCAGILAGRPDVMVHIRSAFLQGLLTASSPERWPAIAGVDPTEIIALLRRLSLRLNRVGVRDLLIAYVRSQPWIHGVVVGQETLAQLQENLELFRRPRLTATELNVVHASLPKVTEHLLDPARWP